MADVKISALGAISAVAGEDLIAIVDDPSGTPASRKATITQVLAFINANSSSIANLVEDTTPDLGGTLTGSGFDQTGMGTISMTEQAAANADVAGDGQMWVKTATPNQLWFTDDAGTDFELANLTGTQTFTNKTLTSPTLTTPALGTPSALVLTNATGTLTSPTFVTPALGTPASGVATNITGLPIVAGTTGTLSVARGGTGVTASTGTGSTVLSVSPALTGTATGVNLTLSGDLTVNGTTSTINSTTLTVDDKNIEMGSVDTPSDTTANGGGITLKGATDKTIIWDSTNSNFTSNQDWNIASGKVFKVNNVSTLTATALGSAVVGSSLTSVGTIATGVWNGTAIASGYIAGDAIDGTKLADDAVDSEHYTDASIDLAHLSADSVDGTKIADDAIDSEHYTDASIDSAHLSTSLQIDDPTLTFSINAQTGTTYTPVLADSGKIVTLNNGSAITLTIPPNSSVAYPVGSSLTFINIGAGLTTFAQGSGVTIASSGGTATAPSITAQHNSATCIKIATDTWQVIGAIE